MSWVVWESAGVHGGPWGPSRMWRVGRAGTGRAAPGRGTANHAKQFRTGGASEQVANQNDRVSRALKKGWHDAGARKPNAEDRRRCTLSDTTPIPEPVHNRGGGGGAPHPRWQHGTGRWHWQPSRLAYAHAHAHARTPGTRGRARLHCSHIRVTTAHWHSVGCSAGSGLFVSCAAMPDETALESGLLPGIAGS